MSRLSLSERDFLNKPLSRQTLQETLRRKAGRLLPRSIRATMLLLLLVLLIPVLLYDVTHYYTLFNDRRSQEFAAQLEVARSSAATFDAYVNDILHLELSFGLALTSSNPESISRANRILATSAREYPSVRYLAWLNPAGLSIASGEPDAIGLDMSDRPYYQDIIKGKEWTVSDLYVGVLSDQPTFAVARGVRDEEDALKGIVVATIDPRQLREVYRVNRPDQGAIAVIDRRGWVVYSHPEVKMTWEQRNLLNAQPITAQVLAGKEVTSSFVSPLDRLYRMVGFAPISSIGWAVAASRPEAEVMEPLTEELFRESGTLLLLMIAVFMIALFIAEYVTVPIRHLRQHALAFGRGELDHRAEIIGPRELEELANVLDQMAGEIQTREKQQAHVYEREQIARTEAERQATQMNALLENMTDGVTVVDKTGRIVLLNSVGRTIFSLPTNEQTTIKDHQELGVDLRRLDGTVLPYEEWPINRALRGDRFNEYEIIKMRRDGAPQRLVFSGTAVLDDKEEVALAITVYRNITELRRLEETREEFIHTVSHDLRAPLTIIKGHAQLLERQMGYGEVASQEAHSIEAIVTSARRMNLMIQDLVDSARLESGQLRLDKQPIGLRDFALELLDRAAGIMDVDRVRLDIPLDMPPASADPDRLERILMNLVTNALKYSPDGTEVIIQARRSNGSIMVSVIDHGEGIASDDLPHIFERFYRSQNGRKPGGLGLGLYITKMLVEAHGGHIFVKSEPRKGTTFYLTLPLA